MKITYKDLEIDYEPEDIDGEILYYGSAWANPGALLCDGGETVEEMCENIYNAVKTYNNNE